MLKKHFKKRKQIDNKNADALLTDGDVFATMNNTVAGLKCCARNPDLEADCEKYGCPYASREQYGLNCIQAMAKDALFVIDKLSTIVKELVAQ